MKWNPSWAQRIFSEFPERQELERAGWEPRVPGRGADALGAASLRHRGRGLEGPRGVGRFSPEGDLWLNPGKPNVEPLARGTGHSRSAQCRKRCTKCTCKGVLGGELPKSEQCLLSTERFTPRWIMYLKFSFPCPQSLPFLLLGRICRQVCSCFGKQQ